jgi:hypothetical protein
MTGHGCAWLHMVYDSGTTPQPRAMTHTTTFGDPTFFAPADRVTITITREERDAINAANAAIYCATYDGDLFADMFGA